MKKILSVLVLIVTGITISACTNSQNTLVVGLEAAYAPFNWATQTPNEHTVRIEGQVGYVDGYDVEIGRASCRERV